MPIHLHRTYKSKSGLLLAEMVIAKKEETSMKSKEDIPRQ